METVETFQGFLQEMLEKAGVVKQTNKLEPALARSEFKGLLQRVGSIELFERPIEASKSFRYAVIETAVRGVFNELLVSDHEYETTIQSNEN